MSLYSYKGQEPDILPKRIRLENGDTRTSLEELSQSQLEALGFVGPIEKPAYNKISQTLGWNGSEYTVTTESEKPYPSWVLVNGMWEPPTQHPEPTNGEMYNWDESSTSWVEV